MNYSLSGRPVAAVIRGMKNENEFQIFVREADSGARHFANDYMRSGRTKWLARAREEGWSEVLRSLIYQLARKDVLEYGNLPTRERMDGLVIAREDHDKFRQLGGAFKGSNYAN